jgi:glycosyltransferase involved in cell wall biosynthesis
MISGPLVSIGVPTYNRADKLRHSIEFILAQDYSNIEVVISDNASTDDTPALCEQLCRRDNRIRYTRQKTNVGPIANYMAVLQAASGEMYMALADDDWLAPNYVSSCLETLLSNPDVVLVCGRSAMYRDGKFSHDAATTTLLDDSPTDRVIHYYRTVAENGAFHGVVRRDALLRIPKLTTVMAGDWLWMAAIAYQGKIATNRCTKITKHLGGASASWEAIVAILNLPAWQAEFWIEAIFAAVSRDILTSPVYESLGYPRRLVLLARVALTLGLRWRVWTRWRNYLAKVRS